MGVVEVGMTRSRGTVAFLTVVSALVGSLLLSGCQPGRNPEDVFNDPDVIAVAVALDEDHPDQARELLEQGVDPDSHGKDGETLMQWAIENGGLVGVQVLLEAGASPNEPGKGGVTPTHEAAAWYSDDEPGAMLALLLEHGGDPNVRNPQDGRTPIFSAALAGRSDRQFPALVDAGADPYAVDDEGDTVLHAAAEKASDEQLIYALEVGFDPYARNTAGQTFQDIYWASAARFGDRGAEGRAKVGEWLEEHGIPVNPEADY